jgi:hypothetical protein
MTPLVIVAAGIIGILAPTNIARAQGVDPIERYAPA